MSEPENFLARWSRRKADAEQPADRAGDANEKAESQNQPGAVAEAKKGEAKEEGEEVDLSKLPPIESIGPETDIRAFLQKGIPPELTRAALRRVWTSDPAIRNFIGIAENQYDFATGSDIPGFGPLTPADDVARMVSQIMREGVPRPLVPSESERPAETDAPAPEPSVASAGISDEEAPLPHEVAALDNAPPENDAVQQ